MKLLRSSKIFLPLVVALISFGLNALTYEGPLNVLIGSEKTKSAYMPCEPSIAISQTNPDVMVAGSILIMCIGQLMGG